MYRIGSVRSNEECVTLKKIKWFVDGELGLFGVVFADYTFKDYSTLIGWARDIYKVFGGRKHLLCKSEVE